jgi:large subunit ribosomal protein LP1
MSFADLTSSQKDEFAASLAVLALHDAQVEISADNLSATFSAAGVKVAAYVPQLFADLLGRGLDVEKFLAGPSAGA